MTISELRTLLSGFPAEGTASLLLEGPHDSSYYGEITETTYDVDTKSLTLKGYDN